MSFQDKPLEATATPPASPAPPLEVEEASGGSDGNNDHGRDEKATDSDGSSYSSGGEEDEFIVVNLGEIRKEVQCPICLGIIRKTRTVMECLHRFCRECIDKSMRLGNNECPACRTHCASRRSLRDDPNYDALIAALYPDIDKFEEEELAFQEEEKARNKQIQDSIAATSLRQEQALGKKRSSSRFTASTYQRRNYRNLSAQRSHRVIEEDEGANEHDDVSKGSSSSDDHSAEARPKRYRKRRSTTQASRTNAQGNKEALLTSFGFTTTDIIGWGRGGLRSSLRNENNKLSRSGRLAKLVNHLQSSHENDEVLKLYFMVVSLHEDKIPGLKQPFLSSDPMSSVGNLCQYVALQTSVGTAEIEIVLVKDSAAIKYSSEESGAFDPSQCELHLLNENQTIGEVQAIHNEQNLVLGYRFKVQIEGN